MFDADRPILSSDQDRLNRTQFAKYLARCMLDHKDLDSLTVGLYGDWGVGKTSLINLVTEELNYAASNMWDDEKPIIINFNPWSYSGQQQLLDNFFQQLVTAIRNVDFLENSSRIAHLIELYVSFFKQQPIPKAALLKRTFLEELTDVDPDNVYAWDTVRNLAVVKTELDEILSKQKHKLIIIIDNISQLYADEIKQIFQIVKSIANYKQSIYLLAFEKQQVINSLNKLNANQEGQEFLEKIVQLSFTIPAISQQDLESIFADRVKNIVKTVPEGTWNADYWAQIYHGSMKFFFTNCRDITRYVNQLQFSYAYLRDVVNPMDFFALTAIEVFAPESYEGIRDNKDLFTDLLEGVYTLDEKTLHKDKQRSDEIIARNKTVRPDILLELIMHLFPRIRRIYEPNKQFFHNTAIARKLRQVCSPDMFDAYFRLSLQANAIPATEFNTILAEAAEETAFDNCLTRLNQDDRILLFLDQLDSKVLQIIPKKHIPAIVNALIDNGDLFPQGVRNSLTLDTQTRIHRIIHALLQRLPSSEERFAVLQHAIANASKSIYTTAHEITEQAREHEEEADTYLPSEFRDLSYEQLQSLQKLAVARIESWAHNGSLVDHPQLLDILYALRDFGDEEYCVRFVDQITKTDRGLLAFLTAALNQPIDEAYSRYEKSASWDRSLDNINAFISAHMLEQHAKQLFEDAYFEKLRDREQLALMIFLDLMKVPTRKMIPKTSL